MFIHSPQPGDLLWVQRKLYNHCGIYEGGGYVIHFAAPDGSEINAENAVIHRTTFEHFKDGCPVKVIDIKGSFSQDETLHRARSRIGTKGYNLAAFNCDHFATWCKTGEYRSIQVDGVKTVLRRIGKISKEIDNKIGGPVETAVELVCQIHDIVEKLKAPRLAGLQKTNRIKGD